MAKSITLPYINRMRFQHILISRLLTHKNNELYTPQFLLQMRPCFYEGAFLNLFVQKRNEPRRNTTRFIRERLSVSYSLKAVASIYRILEEGDFRGIECQNGENYTNQTN